jgi:hypothetical protein
MTRNEKIRKLSNAVKDYLGLYRETTGEWMYPPKSSAILRVKVWLERLKIPVESGLERIHNLRNIKEFHAWLKTL